MRHAINVRAQYDYCYTYRLSTGFACLCETKNQVAGCAGNLVDLKNI
jgi:hypothetical protein